MASPPPPLKPPAAFEDPFSTPAEFHGRFMRVNVTLPPLVYLGDNPRNMNANECEGDCDRDADCADGICFQRDGYTPVPGCAPGGRGDYSGTDYCVSYATVAAGFDELTYFSDGPNAPLGRCAGDCDRDSDVLHTAPRTLH